jgi:hypothetical protein
VFFCVPDDALDPGLVVAEFYVEAAVFYSYPSVSESNWEFNSTGETELEYSPITRTPVSNPSRSL